MNEKTTHQSIHPAQSLQNWFEQPIGQRILAYELNLVRQLLPQYFGYFLVHVGPESSAALAQFAPIKRCFHLIPQHVDQPNVVSTAVQASLQSLPFQKHSVDLLLLQHSLDTELNPHQLLREVDRILVPGGALIILGFNPWSLWGLERLVLGKTGLTSEMPWSSQFISPYRLTDWLKLLNFEVDPMKTGLPLPPNLGRLSALPIAYQSSGRFGGIYLLSAKKRQSMLTPIKPRWSMVGRRFQGSPIQQPIASAQSSAVHAVAKKMPSKGHE